MEDNEIFSVLININKQFNIKKNIIIILHLLNLYQIKIQIKIMVIMNNGNFICVFECRIVNLATYGQFTNVA